MSTFPMSEEAIAGIRRAAEIASRTGRGSTSDPTSPAHYDFDGVQVIDITRHLSFPLGNVVKYVTRAGRKGDALEDLLKARKYLDWAIEDAENERPSV